MLASALDDHAATAIAPATIDDPAMVRARACRSTFLFIRCSLPAAHLRLAQTVRRYHHAAACPVCDRFSGGRQDSMSSHPTDFTGSVTDALRDAIRKEIPDAEVQVAGGGGHFTIDVVSPAFAGKNMLQSQRLVYAAIAHLMSGDMAPVHAIDSLTTRVPSS